MNDSMPQITTCDVVAESIAVLSVTEQIMKTEMMIMYGFNIHDLI